MNHEAKGPHKDPERARNAATAAWRDLCYEEGIPFGSPIPGPGCLAWASEAAFAELVFTAGRTAHLKARPSLEKRKKERARQDRKKDKAEKREQRKVEKQRRPDSAEQEEDPDIAGIVPGPQPLPEQFAD